MAISKDFIVKNGAQIANNLTVSGKIIAGNAVSDPNNPTVQILGSYQISPLNGTSNVYFSFADANGNFGNTLSLQFRGKSNAYTNVTNISNVVFNTNLLTITGNGSVNGLSVGSNLGVGSSLSVGGNSVLSGWANLTSGFTSTTTARFQMIDGNTVSSNSMNAGQINDMVYINAPFSGNTSIPNNSASWGLCFVGASSNNYSTWTAGKTARIHAISEDTTSGNNRAVALTFQTSALDANPIERLRISSNGNLGISCTQPSYALDIVGSVRATTFIGPMSGDANNATNLGGSPANSYVKWANVGITYSGAMTTNYPPILTANVTDFSNCVAFSYVGSIQGNNNYPTGTTGTWWNLVNVRHMGGDTSQGGNNYGGQITWGMNGSLDTFFFRSQSVGTWNPWYQVQTVQGLSANVATLTSNNSTLWQGVSRTASSIILNQGQYSNIGPTTSVSDNTCGISYYNGIVMEWSVNGWYWRNTFYPNNNNSMTLTTGGDLSTSSSVSAPTITGTSDKRLKSDYKIINNADLILDSIHGYKGKKENPFNEEKMDSYYVIADELLQEIPELVFRIDTVDKYKDDKIKTVDYMGLIPILIEALKIRRKEIKDMEKRISDIEDLLKRV